MRTGQNRLSDSCQPTTAEPRKRGPVFVGKAGSVQVPVYRHGKGFLVVYRQNGQRVRPFFGSEDEARRAAKAAALELAEHGGGAVLTLAGDEKRRYEAARSKSLARGIELDSAISEWAEARDILGDVSPVVAARHYVATQKPKVDGVTVAKAVETMLADKTNSGRSGRHRADLKSRLVRFARDHQCPLDCVTADKVRAWLDGLKMEQRGPRTPGRAPSTVATRVGPRSRNNYLAAVQSLNAFAVRRGWLVRGQTGVEDVERASEPLAEVAILTPDDMRRLLQACRPEMIPFVALGGFAGIRHAELQRMTWGQVRWDEGLVEVRSDQSKNFAKLRGRARRLIPMSANLRAWLEPHKGKDEEPISPLVKTDNELVKLARAAGIAWKVNALRHSFGSYRLAQGQDEGKVALEMGNSPQMIFAHYRAVVSADKARAWFELFPIAATM